MGVKKEKRRQLFTATEIKHYHSPFVSKSLGVPCYSLKDRDVLAGKKGPERIRASRICLASPRGFEPLLPT